MGIKKINQLLKKYAISSFTETHLSRYDSMKVAIDVSLYIFKTKARASTRMRAEEWINDFMYILCSLRRHNIHPVLIYDNKGGAPIEKSLERVKRAEKRKSRYDRISSLEKSLSKFMSNGEIDEVLDEFVEMAKPKRKLLRSDEKEESKLDSKMFISIVSDKIERLKSMMISVTDRDFELTRELCGVLNIPYFQAKGEADALCGYLSYHGYVDAVLSDDSDLLAYGVSRILTNIDTVGDTIIEISYKKVLEDMEISESSFLDLCIMCGTDYNANIRGIGPEKSYGLIKKYGSIEKVLECGIKDLNENEFNYNKCRELFSISGTERDETYEVSYSTRPDMNLLQEFLTINNIRIISSILQESFGCRKITFIN